MEYTLAGKSHNLNNVDNIIENILLLKRHYLDQEIVQELINIFRDTNNYKLLDNIALVFADINSVDALNAMVDKLHDTSLDGHNSTIIYSCSEYDCSKHVVFFSELLTKSDYQSMLESLSVLKAIYNPVDRLEKSKALQVLNNSLLIENHSEDDEDIIREGLETVTKMKEI